MTRRDFSLQITNSRCRRSWRSRHRLAHKKMATSQGMSSLLSFQTLRSIQRFAAAPQLCFCHRTQQHLSRREVKEIYNFCFVQGSSEHTTYVKFNLTLAHLALKCPSSSFSTPCLTAMGRIFGKSRLPFDCSQSLLLHMHGSQGDPVSCSDFFPHVRLSRD